MLRNFLDQLVTDWFALLDYCKSDDFDRKQFKVRHDTYAKSWSRMGLADQGYVCEQIANRLKEV